MATDSHTVDEADVAALQAMGVSQDDVWDIGAIGSFVAMSNRLANIANIPSNDGFYLLGRVPKA